MLMESMRYAACVGAMSLSHRNTLGRKVFPVSHSCLMGRLTRDLVKEGIGEDHGIRGKGSSNGRG